MSVERFLLNHTTERIGAAASVAALRKAYIQQFGSISRGEFLTAAAVAGFGVISPQGKQSFIVNRAMVTEPAAVQPAA